MNRLKICCTFCLSVLLWCGLLAADVVAHDLADEMNAAMVTFIQSLDQEQRDKLQFDFNDSLRKDWHFIPKQRQGIALDQLNHAQRYLAMSVLQTTLSHRGFDTSMKIMALEQVLFEMERSSRRDAGKYHLFVFGTPDQNAPWGWRIEGHHLSISITVVDSENVEITPAFFGASPAEVRSGKLKGLRALAQEEDLARSLIKQLTVEQKSIAIMAGEAPRDVILGPGRDAQPLEPAGIAASQLDEAQQKLLAGVIDAYVNKFRPELAKSDWTEIKKAGFNKIHFAWAGKIAPGEPHYYRIQGPSFVMEYDNTQNGANHVHTVWRDLKNDFGEDRLRKHYELVPHGLPSAATR
jgi:hypothetical protein